MKRFEPKSVFEVLQSLFAWTKLFGLTPFAISRNGFKTSAFSFGITVVLLLLYGGVCVRIIATRETDENTGIISRITNLLEIYTTNFNMVVAILMGCVNRGKIVNLINNIHQIDVDIQKIFPSVDFKTSYKSTALYLTIAIFAINIYLFLTLLFDTYLFWHKTFTYSVLISLTYMCPKTITFFVIMQFSFLNTLLYQRFKIINGSLDEVIDALNEPSKPHSRYVYIESAAQKRSGRKNRFPSGLISDRLVGLIDKLRVKHFDLCNITSELNYVYSVQLLFISLQIFVNLLSSTFYSVKKFMVEEDEQGMLFVVVFMINTSTMAFAQILVLTVSCSKTRIEAKKTGSIIHKTVPNTSGKELEFELFFFSLQLVHHNVEYTVCRLFILDESLLISMIGAICTYLVIVVQFEFGAEEKFNMAHCVNK